MAIGESIKQGHDHYRRIFNKLFATTPGQAQLREQLFMEYARALYAHHDAEELKIFPKLIKVPEYRELTLELIEEHETMKDLIKRLRELGYDKKMWRYKLSPLYSIMRIHWRKEEEQIFPFAVEHFSQEELDRQGKEFDDFVLEFMKKGEPK